jgi:hypothetical protein
MLHISRIAAVAYLLAHTASATFPANWTWVNGSDHYCNNYDADECVADGAVSECFVFYLVAYDCYTCQWGGGLSCADVQTFVGDVNDTMIYCDSSSVLDAAMCGTPQDDCFDSWNCGWALEACLNNTDCNHVIDSVDDSGDYATVVADVLDLCTMDGYICGPELYELTDCVLANCVGTWSTEPASTDTETTDADTETTEADMDTTVAVADTTEDATDAPATSEDDGSSDAARLYAVVAMVVTLGMMMIAF